MKDVSRDFDNQLHGRPGSCNRGAILIVLMAGILAGSGLWLLQIAEANRKWQSHGQSTCLLYTSPSPRDGLLSRMPSSA